VILLHHEQQQCTAMCWCAYHFQGAWCFYYYA
jgi:hypothetical protein